jgi:hypothetical protein
MERTLINSRYEKITENNEGEKRYFDYADHSGLLIVEKNAMLLLEVLNITSFERTRDVIQVDYKASEDIELTVLVTSEAYQFRFLTIEWTKGSYAPEKTSRAWKTLEVNDLREEEVKSKLLQLVDEGVKKMKDNLITCIYCKEKFHPSHTIDGDVCHSCAVKYLDVVF